jgi:hypothetical protein
MEALLRVGFLGKQFLFPMHPHCTILSTVQTGRVCCIFLWRVPVVDRKVLCD